MQAGILDGLLRVVAGQGILETAQRDCCLPRRVRRPVPPAVRLTQSTCQAERLAVSLKPAMHRGSGGQPPAHELRRGP